MTRESRCLGLIGTTRNGNGKHGDGRKRGFIFLQSWKQQEKSFLIQLKNCVKIGEADNFRIPRDMSNKIDYRYSSIFLLAKT